LLIKNAQNASSCVKINIENGSTSCKKNEIKIKNPKEIVKNRWKEKTFQKLGLQRNPQQEAANGCGH